jgi:very-short-patch-repair endonuclease
MAMHARPVTDDGFDPFRPFRRKDAIAAGIPPKVLSSSRFRTLFRGILVDASVRVCPRLRVAAALVPFHPTAFASHASAARVHRIPIPILPDEHVSVVDPDHRRNRAGIRCHVVRSGRVRTVDGIRASDYAQTFVELAELLTLVDLVIVGDHLARKNRVTPEQLVAYCAESAQPGAPRARRAAAYVRRDVDSPMETRLRMLIVLAGLPAPKVNHVVRDETGHPVRRYDLWYERSETLVEYDGRQHIERDEQWESDIERREELDDAGRRIIVVTSKGVYRCPERTLLRIQRILRERGEPGVPSRLSDDWRPHFPGTS